MHLSFTYQFSKNKFIWTYFFTYQSCLHRKIQKWTPVLQFCVIFQFHHKSSHMCQHKKLILFSGYSSILPATHAVPTSPLPKDKEQTEVPRRIRLWCLFLSSLLTSNLSTHLKHQIRRRLMSQSPPPERVALGGCTPISYTLAQTEKELRGAEMLLLLAKLIHLHATLSPWQFHNKSREIPIEAGQQADAPPRLCPRLSA